jgi:hypothetical protein
MGPVRSEYSVHRDPRARHGTHTKLESVNRYVAGSRGMSPEVAVDWLAWCSGLSGPRHDLF